MTLLIKKSCKGDVLVPCSARGPEPLLAVYRKSCLQSIKNSIENGERRVASFFSKVTVSYLPVGEVRKVDAEEISFFNINTQQDLEKALEMAKRSV